MSLLGGLISAATNAVGTNENAQANAAKSNMAAALQRFQLQRQDQQDLLQQAIQDREAHSQALKDQLVGVQTEAERYKAAHPLIDPNSPDVFARRTEMERQKIIDEKNLGYHAPVMPFEPTAIVDPSNPNGPPQVGRFDKRTGTTTPTGYGKPVAAGGGHGLGALSPQAIEGMYNQAVQADSVMKGFEEKYRTNPGSLGTMAQGLGAGAYQHQNGVLSGFSGALSNAALGMTNGEYQQYLAAQKRFGNIMGNLMSRRYSEYQGALDTQLAGLSSGDVAPTLDLKQSYRKDLLDSRPAAHTQNVSPPGNPAPTGSGALTPGQLWDQAVQKHGEQTVLQEFGPRPAQ